MVLAEVNLGLETIAGGGVTAMLIAVMTAVLRRTKEADERTDEFSKLVVATANEREARAWTERDAARTERDEARHECERLRALLEAERARREDPRPWMTPPNNPSPGSDTPPKNSPPSP